MAKSNVGARHLAQTEQWLAWRREFDATEVCEPSAKKDEPESPGSLRNRLSDRSLISLAEFYVSKGWEI